MEQYTLTSVEQAKLISEAAKLKPGEMKEGVVGWRNIVYDNAPKIIATFTSSHSSLKKEGVIVPFTVSKENDSVPFIHDKKDSDLLERKRHHLLDYSWWEKSPEKLGGFAETLMSGFIKEEPKEPTNEYYDERGFYYSYRCDTHGNQQAYMFVTIGDEKYIGVFLDEDRNIIEINGKKYQMNEQGQIVENIFLQNDNGPRR